MVVRVSKEDSQINTESPKKTPKKAKHEKLLKKARRKSDNRRSYYFKDNRMEKLVKLEERFKDSDVSISNLMVDALFEKTFG